MLHRRQLQAAAPARHLDPTPEPKKLVWNILAYSFLPAAIVSNNKFDPVQMTKPTAPGGRHGMVTRSTLNLAAACGVRMNSTAGLGRMEGGRIDEGDAVASTTGEKIDVILDHVESLQQLCEMFFGHSSHLMYRSIASALRILLVGSSGDLGLFPDVHPGALFHPLRVIPNTTFATGHLNLPGEVMIIRPGTRLRTGAGVRVQSLFVKGSAVRAITLGEMFDLAAPPIPIRAWLDQKFLWSDRTLGDFFKTVANKDGVAHFNPTLDLLAMKRWGHIHCHIIAALGRYVMEPILEQITAAFPSHVRAVH